MRLRHQPRGCLRFLDDWRQAVRMAWGHCRPPLFVIAVGLVHFPVSLHPELGAYRWVVVALGALSLVLGVGALHMLMLGQDRLAVFRARAAARAVRRAGQAEPGEVAPGQAPASGEESGEGGLPESVQGGQLDPS